MTCFDALGDFIKFAVALGLAELFRPGLDDVGARIGNFIDAMAKAHDQLFRRHHLQQTFFGFVRRGKLLDQLHGGFVGAAVQRAAQRADAAGDSGIKVRQRGRDGPRGKSGSVELMLGVENQRSIDGAAVQIVGLLAVQQIEKMAGGIVVVGFGVECVCRW